MRISAGNFSQIRHPHPYPHPLAGIRPKNDPQAAKWKFLGEISDAEGCINTDFEYLAAFKPSIYLYFWALIKKRGFSAFTHGFAAAQRTWIPRLHAVL
jgi:hypothetical protein